MINKYHVRKLKKILEKNTHYENRYRGDEPTPYIMTNEKDYYKIMKYIDKILKGDNNGRKTRRRN